MIRGFTENSARTGAVGSLLVLLGILLSGPIAVALVHATHPQAPWQGPATFARSYHVVQLLPYAGGIVLVGAVIVLLASIHALARDEQRARTSAALMFASAFASLIFLNYIIQTTYVPVLAREYDDASAAMLTALSMANPKSLTWGLEMWGWGLLGVATWLAAPFFQGGILERAAALAFTANGPLSILGALWTVARPGWVLTTPGLAGFGLWNVLLATMAALAFLVFHRRLRAAQPATRPMSAGDWR